jgi:uncharacterized surface protein with fasciclin (FAS1) repeats
VACIQSYLIWCLHLQAPNKVEEFMIQTASKVHDDAPTLDIVDTASVDGRFSTLSNALKAAGLVDVLKGTGPFTVFAPTDAAFRNWPVGTLNGLLKDKAKFAGILTYHVLRGKIMVRDAKSGGLETVQGDMLRIVVNDDGVRVNNAKLVKTDIEASNGVIHGIDTVLMPD